MKKEEIELLKKIYQNRNPLLNKHDFNRMLIIAGSESYPGAGIICSEAGLISGVGYVSCLIDFPFQQVMYNQEITRILRKELSTYDEKEIKLIDKYGSIVFGNGLIDSKENRDLLEFLILNYNGKLIIDATGIFILKNIGLEFLLSKNRKCKIVLTPNTVETSFLLNLNYIENKPLNIKEKLIEFAHTYNIYLFSKYYDTLFISPTKKVELVEGKVTSLGKAGSGDGYAGLLGGFLCYVDEDIITLGKLAYTMLIESAINLETNYLKGSFGISEIISNIPKYLFKLITNDDK